MVTDPFHEDRSMAIVSDLGFTPYPTPTRTSPINGLVDGAVLLEGGARRGPRPDHRVPAPARAGLDGSPAGRARSGRGLRGAGQAGGPLIWLLARSGVV